jgi:epoxyqueuosine reductase
MFSEILLRELGIVDFSYTDHNLPKSYDKFSTWIDEEKHQPLTYLSDHRKELRRDIKNYYPEFQSALVFLFDYSAEKKKLDDFYNSKESNGLKISSYVFGFNGEDYHSEIRRRLDKIVERLKEIDPKINVKLSLDIHPVLERDLAFRSGLGWFGKNSMLINRKEGSFVMLASLLLDRKLEIESKPLETDHCGTCTTCITACPTDAIDEKSRTLISEKCISTWTIELFKDASPLVGHPDKSAGEIFGCDICQDVCPWNIKKLTHTIGKLNKTKNVQMLMKDFLTMDIKKIYLRLIEMSNSKYRKIYSETPLGRTGRISMLKNLKVYLEDN